MNLISFIAGGERFDLPLENIPEGSILRAMTTTSLNVNKDENGCYILKCDKEDFIPIYEYLKNGKVPSCDDLSEFDYFGINLNHSYELASVIEEDMRTNMYKDDFKKLYIDDHYGLTKINETFWSNFKINKLVDKNLLFNTKILIKSEWSIIKEKLYKLKKFTDIKGVFVAGGSIFSILFGLPINDIDLFIYGMNEEDTINVINEISKLLVKEDINQEQYIEKANKVIKLLNDIAFNDAINQHIINMRANNFFDYFNNHVECIKNKLLTGCFYSDDLRTFNYKMSYLLKNFYNQEGYQIIYDSLYELTIKTFECTRTNNAITFKCNKSETQIILRLYQTPSEVLHGFDVDSCCLGFDGDDVWMTQRAYFALKNGYNTVNFNRLSPSYELRLAKYGCRGMAIKINNFDIGDIDGDYISEYFTNNRANYSTQFYINHAHLSELHNIDKLLYLDYYCQYYNYKIHSVNMINKLNHEKSDYAAPAFVDYKRCSNGSGISDLMGYFYDVYVDYLEFDINEEKDGPVDFVSDIEEEKEEIHPNLSRTSKFLKSEVNDSLRLLTNSIYNKFWFIKGELKYLNSILNIPDLIYDALALAQPWDLPAKLKFKTTNPGEQMTNTFHKIILEDNSQWYKGKFYKSI